MDVDPVTKRLTRRGVLLVGRIDAPVIELYPKSGNFRGYFFAPQDASRVEGIVKSLTSNSHRVFVGGGVTESWLFEGEPSYSFIRLLAVCSKLEDSGFMHNLDSVVKGYPRLVREVIGIGSYAFKVSKDEAEYDTCFNTSHKPLTLYKLYPVLRIDEIGKWNPSPINLTFMSQAQFDRHIGNKRG